MLGVICRAAAAFAATNLDDILLLCLLFSRANKGKVALGQCLGMGTLTLLSLLGGRGLGLLPDGALGLLGLVPLALGLRMLAAKEGSDRAELPLSALGVAGLALANGGDNLGVWMPLFARLSAGERAVTVLVFALLTGLWCVLGAFLARLPALERFLRRWGHRLVPVVLVLLGVSMLAG